MGIDKVHVYMYTCTKMYVEVYNLERVRSERREKGERERGRERERNGHVEKNLVGSSYMYLLYIRYAMLHLNVPINLSLPSRSVSQCLCHVQVLHISRP